MQMEMFMKGNGSMTKLMEKEHILMLMVHSITEIGSTTNSMDSVWNLGLMVQNMKAITSMERKKAKVN